MMTNNTLLGIEILNLFTFDKIPFWHVKSFLFDHKASWNLKNFLRNNKWNKRKLTIKFKILISPGRKGIMPVQLIYTLLFLLNLPAKKEKNIFLKLSFPWILFGRGRRGQNLGTAKLFKKGKYFKELSHSNFFHQSNTVCMHVRIFFTLACCI